MGNNDPTKHQDRWQRLRNRLDAANAQGQADLALTDEKAAVILRRRAKQLAQPATDDRLDQGRAFVAFHVGNEAYAVESQFIQQVVEGRPITRVAGLPPALIGLCSLRGGIVPVADLSSFFGLGAHTQQKTGCLVILGFERPDLALSVGQVDELAFYDLGTLAQVPDRFNGATKQIVHGVSSDHRILLDGEALLTDQAFFVQ